MAYSDNGLHSLKIVLGVHCLQIRHKDMYITSVPNPGEEQFYDPYDAGAYWCIETQTNFGPDGQPVRPDVCQGARGCCKH
jgi:hypothetical protein